MIKIAHEAPKSIFKKVQGWTNYDYALVHLFEEDPGYLDLFKTAIEKQGREVILDNSIFELGKSFDPDKFLTWIRYLKPTYYIVPDALEDAGQTMANMESWVRNYLEDVPKECQMIGVVQGKTYEDIVACYKYMNEVANVDKIAISFDYSLYEKLCPHTNKLVSWALGRVQLINMLLRDGVINRWKPHHLLGCAIPGEGIFYSKDSDYDFIDSVDTSNPVVHGYEDISYSGPLGLTSKSSTKLYTLMNEEVSLEQWRRIVDNIQAFRRLWNGNYGDRWRLEIR